jgi:DNA-binding ferritin-like protein (Dps family)
MLLEEGGDIADLGNFIKNRGSDIEAKKKQEKAKSEEIKKKIENLPPDKKQRYRDLESQLKKQGISAEKKAEIQEEMINIVESEF